MKHIKLYEEFIAEATDYAVMLTGGSIGDKSRPRDAKGYVGMDVDKAEWLMSLDNAKEKAKRMNANMSPGEKSHYGLKYVVVPVKGGKFIKESEEYVNELLNEDALTMILLLQAAAVGGQFYMLANRDGFHPIDDLKMWWADHKRDKAVNTILAKLKNDSEVVDFLNLPANQQEGKWKKLIEPKLSAEELKYLNSVSRDRVKAGKIK